MTKLTAVLAGRERVSASLTALRRSPGVTLAPLLNPAGEGEILSGYEAYTDSGAPVTGTAASYDEGYEAGLAAGSSEVTQPLSYLWDENTMTLTITEV